MVARTPTSSTADETEIFTAEIRAGTENRGPVRSPKRVFQGRDRVAEGSFETGAPAGVGRTAGRGLSGTCPRTGRKGHVPGSGHAMGEPCRPSSRHVAFGRISE